MMTTRQIVKDYLKHMAEEGAEVTVTGPTDAIIQSWGEEYRVSGMDGCVIAVVGMDKALDLLGL